MKYLLLAPLLLLSMAFVPEQKDQEKSPNPCSVSFCKPDNTLAKGQARIEFTCSDANGISANTSILMSYNGIQDTIVTDKNGKASMTVKAGRYMFQFYLNSEHYEIYSDSILIKAAHQTGIGLAFQSSYEPAVAEKPVIYVYPDKTKQINIQLGLNGNLGFTYPQYKEGTGWNFTADPNGTIHMNGKEFDYLFWDGETVINMNLVEEQKGFIVEKDSLSDFFEAKLTAMGLTPRERQDFITYWCPRMQENEKSYVHFMFNDEYAEVAALNVTPAPDHVFRIFMLWSDAAEIDATAVSDQEIQSFTREGFSVVEWGGAKMPQLADQL
ncbi:MAG TPA: hypothetical protein VK826_15385 [Bacteroidia bacterium]|nr:hypothetical protein [Bacteroidia bacterium]